MSNIKDKIKERLPFDVLHCCRMVYSKSYRKNGERRHYFGEKNGDKTYYVFRMNQKNWGVFTIVFDAVLPKLEEILKKGVIPVFDFQNYRPEMMEDSETINLWYRYFSPSNDFTPLSEVYQSKNVIFSGINMVHGDAHRHSKAGISVLNTETKRELFNTYCLPSDEVEEKAKVFMSQHFNNSDRILGISVRECYRYVAHRYEDGRYLGHPKVLPLEEQIETVEQYMKEWKCNKLFLMIDDREGLELFQKHFGDRLIHFEHPLAHYFRNGQIQLGDELTVELDGNNGNRLINYMVEVELLARCDCMISGLSSGAEAAILRNDGKYEHCELIDLGVYKADDVKK